LSTAGATLILEILNLMTGRACLLCTLWPGKSEASFLVKLSMGAGELQRRASRPTPDRGIPHYCLGTVDAPTTC